MIKKVFLSAVIVLLCFSSVFALNKIRQKDLDWYIYETEHFRIYYYRGEDLLAKMTAIYAEEGYNRAGGLLGYKPKEKIPLFIYEDHLDFSSTNVTTDYLGEGTGGFTEPMKNRVVLPGSGSIKLLREVVYHEITHAIQFDIMMGEGARNYTALYKGLFVPLWVIEGMAEYSADDFDSRGDMVLRDAVINNRLIPLRDLDGFNHLEEVYLAYKEAESVFDYIASNYGEDKLALVAAQLRGEAGPDAIFKKSIKKEFDAIEREWEYYIKKKYWAQAQGRETPEKYGPRLTNAGHSNIVYNQAPEFSPDGSMLAYISTDQGYKRIYVMRGDGRESRDPFNRQFEGIATEGNPISWGADNETIYFACTERGRRYIFKGSTRTGSVEKIEVEGFTNLYSPAVSPGGSYIAFTGLKNGFSDIYLYEVATGAVTNLTANVFANNSAAWSPDGAGLLFTEERGGYSRVASYILKSGKKTFLTPEKKFNAVNPRYAPDGKIIYSSDKNGIYNLYSLDTAKRKEEQLTNVVNGIFNPSVSEDYIAYSYYEDACYNVYKMMTGRDREFVEIPLFYSEELETEKKKEEKAKTAPKKDAPAVTASAGDDADYVEDVGEKAAKTILSDTKYTLTFTPDIIFALFGFGTDTGLVGGGYVSTSDMLGDHNLGLYANIVPGVFTQVDFSYIFMGLPFDVGLSAQYNQNVYELYNTGTGEFFSQLDTTESGGQAFFQYPLDLYTSVGMTLSTRKVRDVYTNYDTANAYLFEGNAEQIINTAAFYVMNDYTAWRDFWPYSGSSVMAYFQSSDRFFGGNVEYSIYELDVKKHFDLAPLFGRNMSLSGRALVAVTEGRDRPNFIFGGLGTVRGLGYGEFKGDRVGIASAELRYTVAKNMNFELWPLSIIMIKNIKTAIFADAGIVRTGTIDRISAEEVKAGAGVSVVIDTFLLQRQFTPIKLEVAKRTDITDDNWRFYFSLATGF